MDMFAGILVGLVIVWFLWKIASTHETAGTLLWLAVILVGLAWLAGVE